MQENASKTKEIKWGTNEKTQEQRKKKSADHSSHNEKYAEWRIFLKKKTRKTLSRIIAKKNHQSSQKNRNNIKKTQKIAARKTENMHKIAENHKT